MKEILEIIRKHWFYPLHPMLEQTNLTSELESFIKENYVEKEFVKWKDDIDTTGFFDGVYYIFDLSEERGHTLDQVYQYWLSHPELHKDK